jgi:2-dehydro-3-deoxygluconokinase
VRRAVICGTSALHVLSSARPSAELSQGKVRLSPGGPAAVVALQLALLGHRPLFVGNIGADQAGAFVRAELIRAGVDCSPARVAGQTPRVLAVIGSDVELTAEVPDEAVPPLVAPGIADAHDLVYVTGFPDLVPAVRAVAGLGHRPVVDIGYLPLLADPPALLRHAEAIAPAIGTAVVSGATLPGTDRHRLASLLLGAGVDAVLITLGDRGIQVITANGTDYLPAFAVTAVDPLCAGDAFVAGYLCATLDGSDILTASRFGQAVAACKVARFAGFPCRPDVDQFLASQDPVA